MDKYTKKSIASHLSFSLLLINKKAVPVDTYITPAVHVSELVQVGLEGGHVVLLHVAEQTLDGQRGHLQGGGGVHGSTPVRLWRKDD